MECMWQIVKRSCGAGIFSKWSKIYSTEFFLIFLFLVLCVIKKIFLKKYGVTDLVFKIDAIDGKKWVKFVVTEQYNLNLDDLNTTKGTMDRYLKKIAQSLKTVQYSYKPEKSHLSKKNPQNCFEPRLFKNKRALWWPPREHEKL